MCCGARQQPRQGVQVVLAVGVDLHGVGEAGLQRPAEALDHRGTLALVDLEAMDMNAVRRGSCRAAMAAAAAGSLPSSMMNTGRPCARSAATTSAQRLPVVMAGHDRADDHGASSSLILPSDAVSPSSAVLEGQMPLHPVQRQQQADRAVWPDDPAELHLKITGHRLSQFEVDARRAAWPNRPARRPGRTGCSGKVAGKSLLALRQCQVQNHATRRGMIDRANDGQVDHARSWNRAAISASRRLPIDWSGRVSTKRHCLGRPSGSWVDASAWRNCRPKRKAPTACRRSRPWAFSTTAAASRPAAARQQHGGGGVDAGQASQCLFDLGQTDAPPLDLDHPVGAAQEMEAVGRQLDQVGGGTPVRSDEGRAQQQAAVVAGAHLDPRQQPPRLAGGVLTAGGDGAGLGAAEDFVRQAAQHARTVLGGLK